MQQLNGLLALQIKQQMYNIKTAPILFGQPFLFSIDEVWNRYITFYRKNVSLVAQSWLV